MSQTMIFMLAVRTVVLMVSVMSPRLVAVDTNMWSSSISAAVCFLSDPSVNVACFLSRDF